MKRVPPRRNPERLPRFYVPSDNLEKPGYRGLTPDALIELAVFNGLHFHGTTQQGAVFHLQAALCEFGKLGLVCVGDSLERAQALYQEAIGVLDREVGER